MTPGRLYSAGMHLYISELCSDATELPSVISESLRKLALVGVLPCGLFKKMLQQILPVLALGVSFFFIIPRQQYFVSLISSDF